MCRLRRRRKKCVKVYHYKTSSSHKENIKRGRKKLQNSQKTIIKMEIVNLYLPVITSNVNGLKRLVKTQND